MAQPLGKILVIRGGAIGDFILTLPAIAALRARFPGVRLELLGYPHIAELALAGGLVDAVRPIESRPLASFFVPDGDLAPEMVNYFRGFAIVVSYLYDPDGYFRGNVVGCSGVQLIAGPHRPSEAEALHATEVFLKPLERLAIFGAERAPRLIVGQAPRLPANAGVAGQGQPDSTTSVASFPFAGRRDACPTLAVHPGSGSEEKNWPEEKWAALLADVVRATEANVLLVGGEAEGTWLERLGSALPPERVRVARSLPLADLARLLASCDAFVGHDSGITHLAAAVGLPGLVLWGPSNATVWRPLSPAMQVVKHGGGLPALPVEDVFSRLGPLLATPRKNEV